jgi:hypothetical protein
MKIKLYNMEWDSNICKYFPINDNLLASLHEHYLWFSDPAALNDPYDLNIPLIVPKYSIEDLTRFANYMVSAGRGLGRTVEDVVSFYSNNPGKMQEVMQQRVTQFVHQIGICCFSEHDDILLMWSHYADKHRGVCLKFDMPENDPFFNVPIKVHYPSRFPHFDFIEMRKDSHSLLQFLVGTKSADWQYEAEIRIARGMGMHDVFRGAIKFDKKRLTEVIFGYKAGPEAIERIKSQVVSDGYDCLFYKMILKRDDFGLVKEKIEGM